MKKIRKRKKLIIATAIMLVISICCSLIYYSNQPYIEPVPISTLEEEADHCVYICTRKDEHQDTHLFSEWPPEAKTIEKNGEYYIEVFVHANELPQESSKLTIIQEGDAYIQPDKHYIVFLKETNEETYYTIVGGINGIIEIKDTFFIDSYLKPLNKAMEPYVREKIGINMTDYWPYLRSSKFAKHETDNAIF